jgi:LuxR family maltose regulon positive regulatory protein
MVQERLELLVAHASIHYYYLDIALIPPILDRIDNLICGDQEKRIYSGEIEMFRGMCSFFQSEGARSLECFELALESLPETQVEYRVITEVFFGLAGQMSGQGERVSRVLTDWLGEPAQPHPRRTAMLMLTLAIMSYISGDTEEAERYLERHRRFADSYGLEVSQAWTDYLISLIHLQRGNIQAAIPSLEEAASRRYIHYTRAAADALAALTLAYQANGQPEQAVATLQSLEEFATHLGPPLPALAASCAARLELMQGHPESAVRWFGTSVSPPVEAMILWLENPCVTWCRALIAEESGARVGEAEKRLRELAEICEANHNTCQLISILCLLAVACDKRGTTEEALAVLVRALELARSGNFVFPFLELGQPMADLLRKLPEQDANAVYVERILSNFAETEKEPAAEAARQPVSQTLVDPLTSRELDVVELLRKRLRDKEIAAQLFISTQTVNSHLKSVYQKLGVSNRHQAAAKASELGLLSAD